MEINYTRKNRWRAPSASGPQMTISRRKFAQLLGAGAAAAVARPALSLAKTGGG
mgnify:CR=1 FL=1